MAFVVPLIFLAFYAIETERWTLYGFAIFGMLMVKEDVALEVIALGLYVAVIARRRRIGLITMCSAALWFVLAVLVVIPAFRGSNGPIPFLGYDYLGHGIGGNQRDSPTLLATSCGGDESPALGVQSSAGYPVRPWRKDRQVMTNGLRTMSTIGEFGTDVVQAAHAA